MLAQLILQIASTEGRIEEKMYSYQIDELLRNKNYSIYIDDYKEIINSPQICHIKYDPWDDSFVINTDDRYSWRFKVNNNGM